MRHCCSVATDLFQSAFDVLADFHHLADGWLEGLQR